MLNTLTVTGGVKVAVAMGMKHRAEHLAMGDRTYSTMDAESASVAAAWNCALGDLSCDIAYCNYAYCEKPGGGVGIMSECEGWDAVRGMPALYGEGAQLRT